MTFHTKHHQAFNSQIRKDEDDLWIWQGRVEQGKPIITINGVEWDARLVAMAMAGHDVKQSDAVENIYSNKLDCNPAHNTVKIKNSNKYRGIENEDLGKPSGGGDTAITGDGTGQSPE